jgi:hypothetical protein
LTVLAWPINAYGFKRLSTDNHLNAEHLRRMANASADLLG